jgi:hypothetical protein
VRAFFAVFRLYWLWNFREAPSYCFQLISWPSRLELAQTVAITDRRRRSLSARHCLDWSALSNARRFVNNPPPLQGWRHQRCCLQRAGFPAKTTAFVTDTGCVWLWYALWASKRRVRRTEQPFIWRVCIAWG